MVEGEALANPEEDNGWTVLATTVGAEDGADGGNSSGLSRPKYHGGTWFSLDQESRCDRPRVAGEARTDRGQPETAARGLGPADVRPARPARDRQHGKMFIGVGDGKNNRRTPTPTTRRRTRARPWARSCASTRCGRPTASRYGIPADNPFVGRSGYLPEIWALGLRHPQNLCFDRGGTGQFLIADIGQARSRRSTWGSAGANYGWPVREGTFVTDRLDGTTSTRCRRATRRGTVHLPGGAVRPRRGQRDHRRLRLPRHRRCRRSWGSTSAATSSTAASSTRRWTGSTRARRRAPGAHGCSGAAPGHAQDAGRRANGPGRPAVRPGRGRRDARQSRRPGGLPTGVPSPDDEPRPVAGDRGRAAAHPSIRGRKARAAGRRFCYVFLSRLWPFEAALGC